MEQQYNFIIDNADRLDAEIQDGLMLRGFEQDYKEDFASWYLGDDLTIIEFLKATFSFKYLVEAIEWMHDFAAEWEYDADTNTFDIQAFPF